MTSISCRKVQLTEFLTSVSLRFCSSELDGEQQGERFECQPPDKRPGLPGLDGLRSPECRGIRLLLMRDDTSLLTFPNKEYIYYYSLSSYNNATDVFDVHVCKLMMQNTFMPNFFRKVFFIIIIIILFSIFFFGHLLLWFLLVTRKK